MLNIISNRAVGRTMGRTVGRGLGWAAVGAGLLAASVAFGQDADPVRGAQKNPFIIEHVEFPGGPLGAYVSQLQAEAELGYINVLYRNGAQRVEIPAIELRYVHVQTALNSATYGSALEFAEIDGQFGASVYVFTGEMEPNSTAAAEEKQTTGILPVGDLFANGSTQLSDVLEAIDVAVHDETQTNPRWGRPEIRFHEPSGLLIVRGTPSQVATIGEVVSRMSEASTDQRMQHLQQASDRIQLEADVGELQVQMRVASDQHDMAQIQFQETKNAHDAGVLSSVELHQQELTVKMKQAELSIVRARLHAAEEQLDLFKQAESIETSSRVYEFGRISGAEDELRSVLAAIGKLSGPEIKVGQTENELTVRATGAQHTVIAAVIDAMKAAASQDSH